MKQIIEPEHCTGCHACYSICPKQCIEMKADDEGFLHPVINENDCIDCGLCEKVCKAQEEKTKTNKLSYACISKDENIRMQSSSGGIFSVIAEYVIHEGGIVFGAAFDEQFNVIHIAIDNIEDLARLRGSKYVQSSIGDTFKLTKEYLTDGRIVLFTGTPCQIAGLKSYLGKSYDNLYLQDIICHGVPSPQIWKLYLNKEFKNKGLDIKYIHKINFRDKRNGWTPLMFSISSADNTWCETTGKNSYMKLFYSNHSLRNSCYNCRFKGDSRCSDITLADFWGIENIVPQMNDNKGVSLVIINTSKGKSLFDEMKNKLESVSVEFKEAIRYNQSYNISPRQPNSRQDFFRFVDKNGVQAAANKFIKKSLIRRVLSKIKRILIKYMKLK